MGKRAVVSLGAAKRFKVGHLHMIGTAAVIGSVSAMPDIRACFGKKPFCMFDALFWLDDRGWFFVVVFRQAFDLLHVENGVALHERDFPLFFLSVFAFFGLGVRSVVTFSLLTNFAIWQGAASQKETYSL